jgi:hypothetical protein
MKKQMPVIVTGIFVLLTQIISCESGLSPRNSQNPAPALARAGFCFIWYSVVIPNHRQQEKKKIATRNGIRERVNFIDSDVSKTHNKASAFPAKGLG